MNSPDSFQVLLQKAYQAYRAGDQETAARLAKAAAELQPGLEEPWLLLAAVAPSPQASIEYLKRALEVNPASQRARKGMQWAVQRLRQERHPPVGGHAPRQTALEDTAPHKRLAPAPSLQSSPQPGKTMTSLSPTSQPATAASLPAESYRAPQPSTNWPLLIGAVLVLTVLLISILGPTLAPQDPNKENYIFILGPRDFLRPPLPAFTLPDFPFGTDEWGRDILSRLLHAVGPTMNLVLVVAAIRLALGTLIGLISGWTRSWFEKVLDALTSTAIAIPVIFVALFVIASTGQRMGIAAFIIGLSLTGWAETARIIREQTRVIKGQTYVEASQALGASGFQSLRRHVLPQVLPLIWVLLPLEASSALLTTAALGFLGYFANIIWIPIGDWTTLRASGVPDLGEMLALSAKGAQYQPWSMLAAGLVVFIAVLGFNLLGDGLRIQFAPGAHRRHGRLNAAFARLQNWLEERWFDPLSPVRQNAPTILAVGFLALLLGVGGYTLYQANVRENLKSNIVVPGGHLWASSSHDAQSTLWVDVNAPKNPVAVWKYAAQAPIAGGPVVAADGTIYITLVPDKLVAISPEGQRNWIVPIPFNQGQEGIGAPVIGPTGDIYVVGFNGSLTAISPQGQVLWSVLQDIRVNQVLTDAVVDAQGNIYYATDPKVYAVTPNGEIWWAADLPTYSYTDPILRISGDGKYLLFEDTIMDINNGRMVIRSSMAVLDKYVIGTDGEIYVITAETFEKFIIQEDKALVQSVASWDPRPMNLNFTIPRNGGRLPSGYIWVEFGSAYNIPKVVWLDPNGALLTPNDLPYTPVWFILGIDRNNTLIVCGSLQGRQMTDMQGECRATPPGETRASWKFTLDKGDEFPVGGALIPGRIYVASGQTLYALQDE